MVKGGWWVVGGRCGGGVGGGGGGSLVDAPQLVGDWKQCTDDCHGATHATRELERDDLGVVVPVIQSKPLRRVRRVRRAWLLISVRTVQCAVPLR